MKVFGLSLITNECVTSYDHDSEANHEEVLDVGRMRQDTLRQYVSRLVQRFASSDDASPWSNISATRLSCQWTECFRPSTVHIYRGGSDDHTTDHWGSTLHDNSVLTHYTTRYSMVPLPNSSILFQKSTKLMLRL